MFALLLFRAVDVRAHQYHPMNQILNPRPGALPESDGYHFAVWAPEKRSLDLVLESSGDTVAMRRTDGGFFETYVEALSPGARYRFRVDGRDTFPDPASRYQPEGVHGPSALVDPGAFSWSDDAWQGVPLDRLVLYELHIGTFTPEGTFDAARQRLPYLRELGITGIELMPVADFPGRWNWGYDHAALYAPSRAYGRPEDLRRLVDEAHGMGMAVILDVIYNHFGPDGAYAPAFAPFFTKKHETPWGLAVNLDDRHGEGVRAFFIDNALHWLREYHIDGLRLDATHALIDDSPTHFLQELAGAVANVDQGPPRFLIAEDHRNLNRVIRPQSEGGFGIDGVWADDFHHLIRNRTAGDSESYYAAFADTSVEEIARTIRRGWFYEGQASKRDGKARGTDPEGLRPEQFVYFLQNHDQVGNRPLGNRLTEDISLDVYRALSALLLFVPQTPLLFMGQEWAAGTPFLFFTDHEAELGRAITRGRRREFRDFAGFSGEVPDPQDPETFERSRLRWEELEHEPHRGILAMYRDLLSLRRRLEGRVDASARSEQILQVDRGSHTLLLAFEAPAETAISDGADILWHSEDARYGGGETSAPAIVDGRLTFHTPSAVIIRHG